MISQTTIDLKRKYRAKEFKILVLLRREMQLRQFLLDNLRIRHKEENNEN